MKTKIFIILIFLTIVVLFDINTFFSFAQTAATWSTQSWSSDKFLAILNWLIKLWNWLWIVPAIIAWKLMTNEFAYWAVFHLDIHLWTLWNIMKNFANYILWFAFLFIILKSFYHWEPSTIYKTVLPKLLIWSVLIQSSWFLIWAMLDISLIMTNAVAAFPAQFIKENEVQWKLKDCTINLDTNNKNSKTVDCVDSQATTWLFQAILPKSDSVSWPLLYLWFNVFKFTEFTNIDQEITKPEQITLDLFLKALLIWIFLVPLFTLMITNLIRMFRIWIFVIFSPFLVLKEVFKWWIWDKFEWAKNITFSELIWLIFQPVVVVWALSLVLILVVSMDNIFNVKAESEKYNQQVRQNMMEKFNIDTSDWNKAVMYFDKEKTISFTLEWSIFEKSKENIWWLIWYMIMCFFTAYLMWTLVKVWFATSSLTKQVSDSVFKFAEWMMMATPLPWTNLSLWALSRAKTQMNTDIFRSAQARQADRVTELFWWPSASQNLWYENALRQTEVGTMVSNFLKQIKNDNNGYNTPILNNRFISFFERLWTISWWEQYITKLGIDSYYTTKDGKKTFNREKINDVINVPYVRRLYEKIKKPDTIIDASTDITDFNNLTSN